MSPIASTIHSLNAVKEKQRVLAGPVTGGSAPPGRRVGRWGKTCPRNKLWTKILRIKKKWPGQAAKNIPGNRETASCQVPRLKETPEDLDEGSREAREWDIGKVTEVGTVRLCRYWEIDLEFRLFLWANDKCHLLWLSNRLQQDRLCHSPPAAHFNHTSSNLISTFSLCNLLSSPIAFQPVDTPAFSCMTHQISPPSPSPLFSLNVVVHIFNSMLPTQKTPTLREPNCTFFCTHTAKHCWNKLHNRMNDITLNSWSVMSNKSSAIFKGTSWFSGTWSISSSFIKHEGKGCTINYKYKIGMHVNLE